MGGTAQLLSFDSTRMRAASRTMPPAPVHKAKWWAWVFLTALFAGLAYWFWQQPYLVGVLFAVLGFLVWIQMIWETHSRRRLATSRHDESICTFARSFGRRADTWILRAVYEELSRYLEVDRRPIPIRREDRCAEDLKIDPEDLDDLARDIAFRARRSMDACEKNPVYGKVKTVGDIVAFLECQPRTVEPSAAPNGGPATHLANSSITERPPSVS